MSVNPLRLQIPEGEFEARCTALQQHLITQGLSGVALFSSDYVKYYTGFAFIPTERPIAFVMNRAGQRSLFVPRMEREHAQANALLDLVVDYVEYPGKPHPMTAFQQLLAQLNIAETIAADHDGYPPIFGYRGPSLSSLGLAVAPVNAAVEDQMAVKSRAEIALLLESCKWGNLALHYLQRYTAVGTTETEAAQRASFDATQAMLGAIGPIYRAQGWRSGGASATYRGQIGRNSAIPHALANNIAFQAGDVLIGESTAAVWGYVSELERTMIIGRPSAEQRRLFEHMLALQELAFAAIKPGVPCSAVDAVVRQYYDDHDLNAYWRHHTGHAIGMRYHEGPFLDVGDDTPIEVGMVFTVEPGLYHPEYGGFRHSDTVVVTEDGIDLITYYPRDLASLTLG